MVFLLHQFLTTGPADLTSLPLRGPESPESPESPCCRVKTVGGVRFSLQAFHPATALQLGCRDGCSYTSDQLFCFESGGLPSTCEASSPATHSSNQAVILAFNEANAVLDEAKEKAANARRAAESAITKASIDISIGEQIVTSLSIIQHTC